MLYLAIFGFFRVYPMYLVDEFHLGVARVSEYVAFVAVPIVIANVWLVGALSRHARPRTLVRYSALAMGVLMAVIVIPKSTAALWFTLGRHRLGTGDLPPVVRRDAVPGGQRSGAGPGDGQQPIDAGRRRSLSGLAGGALAAILITLPLLVFAGAAVAGSLLVANLARRRPSTVAASVVQADPRHDRTEV